MRTVVSLTLTALALAGFVYAGGPTTPEIDTGTAVAAVALLAGGVLVLRARRKRQ